LYSWKLQRESKKTPAWIFGILKVRFITGKLYLDRELHSLLANTVNGRAD
jgi:hypothetical protein